MKEKIELYQMRTFSQMLSDTFSFVRQNFKPLFKGLFFIAAPALLLVAIAFYFIWKGYMSMIISATSEMPFENVPVSMFGATIPMFLCAIVASTLIMSVSFSYIKLYRQDKESQITVSMLWQESKKHFWKLIGAQFTIGIVVMIVGILLILLAVFLGNGNRMLIFLFLFIILIIFGILVIFFGIRFSFLPFFIVVGDTGVMDSFSGSFSFTRGIFWKTFGFMFVLVMIVGCASYIFLIPSYIMTFISMILGITQGVQSGSFVTLLSSALMSIGMACAYLLYSVIFTGQSIFYFSEIEKEQGVVANREIDEIGKRDD